MFKAETKAKPTYTHTDMERTELKAIYKIKIS